MDFNTLLSRLGVDPESFENKEREPIITNDGFIYEVQQRKDGHECPHCQAKTAYVNSYRYATISCSETDNIKETLRVRKVRLKCCSCHKTFTPSIRGIRRRSRISQQIERFIYQDFTKPLTFSSIAKRYDLSTARIIQVFDEKVKYVPRRTLPEAMCIDEIRFSEELDQKFVCVLYDFNKREIVDLIKNRQSPYLNNYFSAISTNELNKVKYFISDMYDAYSTICHRYFKNSIHIVDLFHVIRLLTTAINQLRVRTMNTEVSKGSPEYNFMKSHWKYFICRTSKIPDKFYTHKKTGEVIHYDDLVFRCCRKITFCQVDIMICRTFINIQNRLLLQRHQTLSNGYLESCLILETNYWFLSEEVTINGEQRSLMDLLKIKTKFVTQTRSLNQ